EVLGVGQRVTALDEIHAEVVEPAGEVQLVLQREVDALALAAVAQRRVVDVDARHGVPLQRKRPRGGSPGALVIARSGAVLPWGQPPCPVARWWSRRTPCAPRMAIGVREVFRDADTARPQSSWLLRKW